jgi:FMN phosphatase YigB (HAD superfamily)
VIKAVLIDLDGTLLQSEMEQFLPPYLSLISTELADIAQPDHLVMELLRGTQLMRENIDPRRTLRSVFASYFYPQLGTSEAALESRLEAFYRERFPQLQPYTQTRPEAAAVVKALFERGFEVVIATDPLFPRLAVEHRLAWAGVPVKEFPYAVITSYEEFCFAKPHLAYYAQILGLLGHSPSETAMIGDNLEADLAPARALGMPVYHVGDEPPEGVPGGSLEGVLPWLARDAEAQADSEAETRPESLIARLRGNLAALLSLTMGLNTKEWRHSPAEGEWAPLEIVCHLRDLEIEVNHPRFQRILTQDTPFIPHADTDHLAEKRDYLSQEPDPCMDRLSQARMETIDMLTGIESKDWVRLGRHSLLGPTSLQELVGVIVEHDLIHLDQLRGALPKPSLPEAAV